MLDRIEKALGSNWIGPVCVGLLLALIGSPWWAGLLVMIIYVNAMARLGD